jgi:hypothetical protein
MSPRSQSRAKRRLALKKTAWTARYRRSIPEGWYPQA